MTNNPNTISVLLPSDNNERREYKKTQEYRNILLQRRAANRLAKIKIRQEEAAIQREQERKEAFEKAKEGFTGRIKDYNNEGRYFVFDDGRIYSYYNKSFKTQCKTLQGYHYIGFGNGDRKLVHRMVAECFIDNPDNKQEINHKNFVKSDNSWSNLEWCTRAENLKHAWDNGINVVGALNPKQGQDVWSAKLRNEQVIEMRELHAKGYKAKELAKMYHITQSHTYRIINRNTWRHL